MSVNWTHELELSFLELYQCYPIIWDPKELDHKDRYKVNDAWKTLSEAMNIPVKELKSKKDSLMTTFRMHKRKIRTSQTSGAGSDDIYSPIWFAFNIMDSFLGDIVDCKKNRTLTTTNEINNQNESQDQQQSQETNPAINDSSSAQPISSQTVQPNRSQTIRRRVNPPELREAGLALNKTLTTLNDVLQKEQNKNTSQEKEDECDLHGKIFAKKLKKLPENERMSFIYEVDGLFLRKFSRNTPDTMHFSPFTHRINRPSSTCTTYSEPILQRDMITPEYQVQERPLSASGLSYVPTSPHQHQLSHQHMMQERPPSTAEFPYINISPYQLQLSQRHMLQERPTSSVSLNATSPRQNILPKPILIHIPEQSPSPNSSVTNSQNSISILSDVTVMPPSDDSSQNYIVEAFKKA